MAGLIETEVKFRVADRATLEARLRALGAGEGPREDEINLLLDDAGRTLKGRGEALRIRVVDGKGLLTFKGRVRFASGMKSRLELESGVDDPERVREILAALGYQPLFRYDKRRVTWRFSEAARPLVVIDETPLGLFAEVEGDAAAVRALARELEVPESAFLAESYASLYLAARAADPTLPPDMVFPAAG